MSDTTANNFGVEQDIVNEKSALKTTDSSLDVTVILNTLVVY